MFEPCPRCAEDMRIGMLKPSDLEARGCPHRFWNIHWWPLELKIWTVLAIIVAGISLGLLMLGV